MIFVDSNVPMYLIGAPHRHKLEAREQLSRLIAEGRKLVTSAEVLQEILHRYAAIGRLDAVQPAFDVVLGISDEIFPVDATNVDRAKTLLLGASGLSARDCLHLAVMQSRKIDTILSFDRAFDLYPGITRLG